MGKLHHNHDAMSSIAAKPLPTALQQALNATKGALSNIYGGRLVHVVLFGSHARGEAHAESDVDVLVVLRGPVEAVAESRRLSAVMVEASLHHDLALSLVPVSEDVWRHNGTPLVQHIKAEGTEL